jgi:hypothetical protein
MKYILFPIILIFCVSCVFSPDSHEIKFLQCDSNCYEIKVSGQIINNLTNTGIPGTLVTLKWEEVNCWFCSKNTIDTTYSNNEGYYNFDAFIDSSYFSNWHELIINIPYDSSYLAKLSPFTHTIYKVPDKSENIINFYLQPAAQLEVHLNRIEKDTFSSILIHYNLQGDFPSWGNLQTYSEIASKKIMYESTAADIKTYISWEKCFNNVCTKKTDWIICKQNQKNVFILNY